MSRRALLPALAAACALAAAPAARPEGPRPPRALAAVRAGRLWTGSEWLVPGVVVLEEGKVASVGKALPAGLPRDAVADFPDAWATPGWVDASSRSGLAGADDEMTRETTPCVRPLRAFDPASRDARRALDGGVTSIFLSPAGANVVGGIASVVKTAPGPAGAARVVREVAALKISLGSDPSAGNFPARGVPSSIYARRPTTRMGVLAVLRDAWLLGRAAGPASADADLAAMGRAAAGEVPVRALARTEEDLRTLLRAAKDLGFTPVAEGAAEGYLLAEDLAKAGLGCVVGPLGHPVSGRGPDGTEPALGNAAALHGAGVRIALTAGGDASGLRDQAILAARFGLPREAALRAVTAAAADLSGAGDRVGTLAPGRDGDLVLFDGDPLEASSRVRLVLVDGEAVRGSEAGK